MAWKRQLVPADFNGRGTAKPSEGDELDAWGILTDRNVAILQQFDVRRVERHQDVYAEGDIVREVMLLRPGWAYRYRLLGDGRRQIVHFLIPGDFVGPHFSTANHFVGTLTDTELCQIPRNQLGRIAHQCPGLIAAIEAIVAREYAILAERTVSLGRRTAKERMAHLLLELFERTRRIGLAQGRSYEFPATQEIIADTLGLSVVHVNRTLRNLREEGLVTVASGRVTITDMDGLLEVAGSEDGFRLPQTGRDGAAAVPALAFS